MATISEATAAAMAHHAHGRFAEAAEIGRRILAVAPENAGLALLVGAARAAVDDVSGALRAFRHVLMIDPATAAVWSNLGNLLNPAENEGDRAFVRALTIDPTLADGHANRSAAARRGGRADAAADAARRALIATPDHLAGMLNLVDALTGLKRTATAVPWAKRAVRLSPDDPRTWQALAATRATADELRAAVAADHRALSLFPGLIAAYEGLVLIESKRGAITESDAALARARVLGGSPGLPRTIASAALALARPRAAITALDTALAATPNDVGLHWNRAVALLQAGEWEDGWREFEWRRLDDRAEPPWRNLGVPIWRGEPLAGRTILLYAEQGLGDALQCLRFVPLVAERGGRVVVEVQPPLVALTRRVFSEVAAVADVMARGEPLPAFDVECPLMSLPGVFGATPNTIQGVVPFLSAEPGLAQTWRERLAAIAGDALKVGLVWAGNPRFADDRRRSPGFAALSPILNLPGTHFFALQKGPGRGDIGASSGLAKYTDLGGAIETLDDTAAIMAGLDLVISSCTAPAHLAGGLGVPLWLALPYAPDWRWLLGRDDTPWYPSTRLFRQSNPGNWATVATRLTQALNEESGSRDQVAWPSLPQ